MTSKSQLFSAEVFRSVGYRIESCKDDKQLRKYKGLCKRAGGILRTVGMIQFLTFLEARGQREAEVQNKWLLQDLMRSCRNLKLTNDDNTADFLKDIHRMQLPQYMHLTREILRLLDWYKRMSDIMIAGTADDYEED